MDQQYKNENEANQELYEVSQQLQLVRKKYDATKEQCKQKEKTLRFLQDEYSSAEIE